MTYLGFFDVRGFAPMAINLIWRDDLITAVKEAGKLTLTTLRDEQDFETAAFFMARFDGMWMGHKSAKAEIEHFIPNPAKREVAFMIWIA